MPLRRNRMAFFETGLQCPGNPHGNTPAACCHGHCLELACLPCFDLAFICLCYGPIGSEIKEGPSLCTFLRLNPINYKSLFKRRQPLSRLALSINCRTILSTSHVECSKIRLKFRKPIKANETATTKLASLIFAEGIYRLGLWMLKNRQRRERGGTGKPISNFLFLFERGSFFAYQSLFNMLTFVLSTFVSLQAT